MIASVLATSQDGKDTVAAVGASRLQERSGQPVRPPSRRRRLSRDNIRSEFHGHANAKTPGRSPEGASVANAAFGGAKGHKEDTIPNNKEEELYYLLPLHLKFY